MAVVSLLNLTRRSGDKYEMMMVMVMMRPLLLLLLFQEVRIFVSGSGEPGKSVLVVVGG